MLLSAVSPAPGTGEAINYVFAVEWINSHFTDEKTEAQRGKSLAQGHAANKCGREHRRLLRVRTVVWGTEKLNF